jgi:hypothetical protein
MIKVFTKDALAHLGPYQTLMRVWYSDPGGEKFCSLSRRHTNLKSPYKQGLYGDSHSEQ